jgi:hypothetical protein
MQNVDLNISDSSTWNDSFESISEHFSSHSISYFLIEKNLSILPLFFMVFGTLGNSIAFYVLTRKKLRGQSTMLYFASLTVMDTLSLYQWFVLRKIFIHNLYSCIKISVLNYYI